MANTVGEKELKTNWPITSGLEADQKHDGRKVNLVPTKADLVMHRRG